MNYGIIITGAQGVGKSSFVDNLSRYFNVCSLHHKADVNKYFNYEIILVEEISSIEHIQKDIKDFGFVRKKYAARETKYKRPLIIYTTNIDLKQEDFRHWEVLEFQKDKDIIKSKLNTYYKKIQQ